MKQSGRNRQVASKQPPGVSRLCEKKQHRLGLYNRVRGTSVRRGSLVNRVNSRVDRADESTPKGMPSNGRSYYIAIPDPIGDLPKEGRKQFKFRQQQTICNRHTSTSALPTPPRVIISSLASCALARAHAPRLTTLWQTGHSSGLYNIAHRPVITLASILIFVVFACLLQSESERRC
jgi:hypothetical protein